MNSVYTYKNEFPTFEYQTCLSENLKCIFSVPFPCYWTWLPLQSASGMPDRNDKLYFLWSSLFFTTFYLPLRTPPLPHLLLSYRLYFTQPCSVRPWGHHPSHALSGHTTKWHQVSLSERISSHLPYVTTRKAGLALWGGRAVRCGRTQSWGRRDEIERGSDLPATWEVKIPRPHIAWTGYVLALM